MSRNGIKYIVDKFLRENTFLRKVGSGRKRTTSRREDSRILREVRKSRKVSSYQIQKDLDLVKVSVRTIRRRIVETGEFKSYWATRKPFISAKNRQLRLEWCKERQHWTVDQWRKVLWSDESPFVLRFAKRFRVWRMFNERYNPQCCRATVKHDKKIMVWGCFAAHGVGKLHRVHGILDGKGYHSILQWQMKTSMEQLFPTKDSFFQQDNDPKHTAKLNKAYLLKYEVVTLPWPSQSPDLNPIENLWSILDEKAKNRVPNTEEELFQLLEEAWNNLPVELLTNLVDSMPRRVAAVIEKKGYATKY